MINTHGKHFEMFFKSRADLTKFMKLRKTHISALMLDVVPQAGAVDADKDGRHDLPAHVFALLTSNDVGDTVAAAEALVDGHDVFSFWYALITWLCNANKETADAEQLLQLLPILHDGGRI